MSGLPSPGSGANGAMHRASEQPRDESLPPAFRRTVRTVCHRVKNDFQTIANIMALAQPFVATPGQMAEAVEGRIGALSVAYGLFAVSGSPPTLDDVAREVVEKAMTFTGRVVPVTYTVQEIPISPRLCSSLSLWLHEIVINSLRHALGGNPLGALVVESQVGEEGFSLTVSDNGPGLPPGFSTEKDGRLGLRMAQALARHDLAGHMDMAWRDPGLAVALHFSREEFDNLNREFWA